MNKITIEAHKYANLVGKINKNKRKMVKKSIIKLATKEAQKSNYSYKVGAVIFKGKNIISTGHNSILKSVRSVTKRFVKWPNNIHAEVDAIIRAKTDLKGTSILVVKVNKSGNLTMAKPCNFCLMYVNYVGIKNVYFSNRKGEIEKL